MTPHLIKSLEDELTQERLKGVAQERTAIRRAWEKAKRKRNGGASGLSKTIEAFDEYLNTRV